MARACLHGGGVRRIKADLLRAQGADIIDLSQGNPRFDLTPSGSTKLPADRRGWPPAGGLPELRVANLADTPLVGEARAQAEWLWQRDPFLKELEHAQLRERVTLFWRQFVAH